MKKISLGIIFLCLSSLSFAANDKTSVENVGNQWSSALSSGNPQTITALYANEALLYATFKNMVDTQTGIRDYFIKLMKHPKLAVKFNNQQIRLFGNTAINSGLYTFSYQDGSKQVTVPARYTFVYTSTPNGWMIVDHHSSVLPDQK